MLTRNEFKAIAEKFPDDLVEYKEWFYRNCGYEYFAIHTWYPCILLKTTSKTNAYVGDRRGFVLRIKPEQLRKLER